MPKSKSRKKSKKSQSQPIDWGASAKAGSGRINFVLAAVATVAIVAGGLYFWQMLRSGDAFANLAAQGQAALAQVETTRNFGGGHLPPGQGHSYSETFPASGIHNRVPLDPGFYDQSQPPTQLVHSIEHGHVVVYYGDPGAEAIELLKDWSSLFTGHWDGVIATRHSGLGKEVVLTAWRKVLKLEEFDAPAAAAFIDAYRGRGPENPVR